MGYQVQYIAASGKSIINNFCHRYVEQTVEQYSDSDSEDSNN